MAVNCEYSVISKYYLLTKGGAKADQGGAKADDDIDLFGNDDAVDLKAAMAAKKAAATAKKPKKVVIAKSSMTLRALPYDSEIDITGLYESTISKIEIDGLVWGQKVSVVDGPFGLKGIQFGCVIEDEKVTQDDIEEAIETLGLNESDCQKYIEMRRMGDLDDYEEEWAGKKVGTLEVVSFQKI